MHSLSLCYRRGTTTLPTSSRCWLTFALGAERTHPAATTTTAKHPQATLATDVLIPTPSQGGPNSIKGRGLQALEEETSVAAAEAAETIITTDPARIKSIHPVGAFDARCMGRRAIKPRIIAAWRRSKRKMKRCMSFTCSPHSDAFF